MVPPNFDYIHYPIVFARNNLGMEIVDMKNSGFTGFVSGVENFRVIGQVN